MSAQDAAALVERVAVSDGGPAFPRHGGDGIDDPRNRIMSGGMTLRAWFAGQALPTVVAVCVADTLEIGETREALFARRALAIADAMLAAIKESPDDGR